MGNEKSHHKHPEPSSSTPKSPKKDPRLVAAWTKLTPTNTLMYQQLFPLFNENTGVANVLWDYLSNNRPRDEVISFAEFEQQGYTLIGDNCNFYVNILKPVKHLIKVCSEAAGATAVQGDEQFIELLAAEIEQAPSTSTWVNENAPRFCEGIHGVVLEKLCGYPRVYYDYESDYLTPLKMWFVKCSLPIIFFPKTVAGENSRLWTPLYSSNTQGISVNRFDANVIDYRGPTVSIFILTDKRKVILASDQEWRHSSNRFGGVNTTYIELSPTYLKIENASNSIYCNYKLRASSFGLSFKEIVKIDKDMSNVSAIEVWGCGGGNTLAEQQKLKAWQSQQAEKNKRVPLPGNWDDNPDKSIMEMAGFQFSNERKLMEMEEQRREHQ